MSTSTPAAADSSTTSPARPLQAPRKHPCVPCQHRKVKCDRNDPCSNCARLRVECVAPNTDLPRKRKKRFAEAELLARLRRYEAYIKNNGLDPEDIGHGATDPAPDKGSDESSTRYATPSVFGARSLKSLKSGSLLNDQYRETEEILQGSSDDDSFEAPMTKSFDSRKTAGDGYDIVFSEKKHGKQGLAIFHPAPLHIFRLWQIFLNNVNPLVKVLHAPTVQQQILDASADFSLVPANMEALMFAIYSMAIASITTEKCNAFFGSDREFLLVQYHAGARQALINAGLLGSCDLVTLQAVTLYLLSNCQGASDPRSLFSQTGIAMRIAQRMGLNNDGKLLGLTPFEAEMRRRLWWQLLLIDNQVAEISGSPPPSYSWSTNPPSNANDNDLFAGMRDSPIESERLTEMMFVLLRCEIFEFTRNQATLDSLTSTKDRAIDAFERHLERKYVQHCDPSAPLHSFSSLLARLEVWKLRSGLFDPRGLRGSRRQLPQNEQDRVFAASLRVMELHNMMLATESIQKFVWYALTNPPFPAYLYLLCGLRTRTSGELADRAWTQLAQHSENRKKHNSWDYPQKSSPLRLAIGNLTLKAWEAREGARSPLQPQLPVPRFISDLRDLLAPRMPAILYDGSGADPLRTCDALNTSGLPSLDAGDDDFYLELEWPAFNNFMQGEVPFDAGETQPFDYGSGST
ncbi:hypothetical protein PV11_08275 [Exophiala sideris]|uniref:Zn(2)-C6 fungal-type domain-containing protein n=1 Tax=Exophiala sideris TaxID=1016849 RepID=A0A0D1YIE6_9EURO|nr:hypothetical protein PV11_08275 [Exophiala sideris]